MGDHEPYWEPTRPFTSEAFQYSEALPGKLWIGEAPRPADIPVLRTLGFTDIVNLTRRDEVLALERQSQFNVHAFPFPDGGFNPVFANKGLKERAHQMMVAAAARLGELMSSGSPTYLHCVAGISRSPTVLILWMLQSGQAKHFREALDRAARIRPMVSPNPDLVDIVRELLPGAFVPVR